MDDMTTEREFDRGGLKRRFWVRSHGSVLAIAGLAGATLMFAGSGAMAMEGPSTTSALPSFADLVQKVKPAVVSIYAESQQSAGTSMQQLPFQDGPFKFFFRRFNGPNQDLPGSGGPRLVRAQGSGFFISPDGYLLTNNHVVDHARRVDVKTTDGKIFHAKVVGTDAKTDLAVLKVDAPSPLPYVTLARDAPRVGDWVLAMGNPYGLGGTVTAGIVSASGRDIGAGPYDDYLQIDAPVNKGNSGGPTFNLKGEVVGVNTAIYSPSGGSIGIAFDIPAATAKTVAGELETKGVVVRGWIGVSVQPVTGDIAESLGLKEAKGALIDGVQRNGPAAKAGLANGDLILSLDGTEVKDARDLARKVATVAPGTTLKLEILRQGAKQTVSLTAGTLPSAELKAAATNDNHPVWGLTLAPADEVSGAGARGVVVTGVDPNGTAAEKGVQAGDVILEVGGKPVANPQQVHTALDEAGKHGKHAALLRLKTSTGNRYLALPVG
jgi:serine protease Do